MIFRGTSTMRSVPAVIATAHRPQASEEIATKNKELLQLHVFLPRTFARR